jgi:hypothetical protein
LDQLYETRRTMIRLRAAIETVVPADLQGRILDGIGDGAHARQR